MADNPATGTAQDCLLPQHHSGCSAQTAQGVWPSPQGTGNTCKKERSHRPLARIKPGARLRTRRMQSRAPHTSLPAAPWVLNRFRLELHALPGWQHVCAALGCNVIVIGLSVSQESIERSLRLPAYIAAGFTALTLLLVLLLFLDINIVSVLRGK